MADAAWWDDRYRADERPWRGEPTGVLVAEVAELPPGRALEVGCGTGADAIWLATRGWTVTAIDWSTVALDRARAAATDVGVEVDWVLGDVTAEPPAADTYDLVSLIYPAIPDGDDGGAAFLDGLLGALRLGGSLLVVGHSFVDRYLDHAKAVGFNPMDELQPGQVDSHFGDGFELATSDVRPRTDSDPTIAVDDVISRIVRVDHDDDDEA